ncbi:MAG TPA: hypothetical protein VFW78_09130 [Bacteroidia bacterium]|nr:hypothetical protein [Bacteroidia bacterium]
MEIRKHLIPVVIAILLVAGCTASKETTTEKLPPPGFTAATVTDYSELDGCRYLLITGDSIKYNPTNLDAAYQHHGMVVWFRFKPVQMPTTCMTGTTIRILEIKEAVR